jgi:hypothetical protein
MTDEEAFEEALCRHGDLAKLDSYPPDFSTGLREQLNFYRLAAPHVYCNFLNNTDFNAVATAHRDREFIGIYLGAIMLIARYAYCLLSDPEVLPQIGNVSLESIEPSVVEALRAPLKPAPSGRYLPRDPTRLRAAQHIAMCAYMILYFHELGHIELCHLKFLRDHLGVTEYKELGYAPLSEQDALLLRTLEWDADNSGLLTSLRMWRSFCSNLDYSAISALGTPRSWFLSAQLLFWVMDFVQPRNRRSRFATHPSPEARLVNARLVATNFGFVPELLEGGTAEDSLIPWIMRNKFPSQIVDDAADPGGADVVGNELKEVQANYRTMMDGLEAYQKLRRKTMAVDF